MPEKINFIAERGGDKWVETQDYDKKAPLDYDVEMKRLQYERLESDNIARVLDRAQKRRISGLVVVIAIFVPLLTLFLVLSSAIFWHSHHFFSEAGTVPKSLLISGSFLSIVVIYTFLIRVTHPSPRKNGKNDKNDENGEDGMSGLPILKEILKVVQSPAGKE